MFTIFALDLHFFRNKNLKQLLSSYQALEFISPLHFSGPTFNQFTKDVCNKTLQKQTQSDTPRKGLTRLMRSTLSPKKVMVTV